MDIVRKWKENGSEKSERFKAMQEQDRLETMLMERKKSANQRELEAHYRKLQEDDIKAQLDKVRKQRTKETWKGKQMFTGKATMLNEGKGILHNDKSILNQKNIFLQNGGFY
jgi:hypothetical protein